MPIAAADPASARWPRFPRTTGARPRRCAMAFGDSSSSSALSVARTTLTGLLLPNDLVSTSLMPAASTTARTPPPAITPVPGGVGPMTRAMLLTNVVEIAERQVDEGAERRRGAR